MPWEMAYSSPPETTPVRCIEKSICEDDIDSGNTIPLNVHLVEDDVFHLKIKSESVCVEIERGLNECKHCHVNHYMYVMDWEHYNLLFDCTTGLNFKRKLFTTVHSVRFLLNASESDAEESDEKTQRLTIDLNRPMPISLPDLTNESDSDEIDFDVYTGPSILPRSPLPFPPLLTRSYHPMSPMSPLPPLVYPSDIKIDILPPRRRPPPSPKVIHFIRRDTPVPFTRPLPPRPRRIVTKFNPTINFFNPIIYKISPINTINESQDPDTPDSIPPLIDESQDPAMPPLIDESQDAELSDLIFGMPAEEGPDSPPLPRSHAYEPLTSSSEVESPKNEEELESLLPGKDDFDFLIL